MTETVQAAGRRVERRVVRVVDQSRRAVPGAQVVRVASNGTYLDGVTDDDGVFAFDDHFGGTVMVLVAVRGWRGRYDVRHRAWTDEMVVPVVELPDGGSLIFRSGRGEVPGLTGLLNPIRDALHRTYVRGDNISSRGLRDRGAGRARRAGTGPRDHRPADGLTTAPWTSPTSGRRGTAAGASSDATLPTTTRRLAGSSAGTEVKAPARGAEALEVRTPQAREHLVKQLGEILLEGGLLSREQLESAVDEQRRLGRSLGRVLVDQGTLSEGQLVASLAQQIGMKFVDLSDFPVDGSAVSRVSDTVCRRHTALPIGYEDGKLLVAMADPANVFAVDDIRSMTGMEVKAVVATKPDVLAAINRYHRGDAELDDLTMAMDSSHEDDDLGSIREVTEDAPIVKFVNLLITQAIGDRASDIHIEPAEKDLRVRFRIDGVLHEIMRSPKSITSGVTSRLKIMADINIAERRVPQDGRLSVNVNGKKIDLRVATLPTVWGEKIVMRILDNSTAMLKLSDLGFADENYEVYSKSFTKPYGMILVTGPTGSGKSTTLYATLNIVSRPEVNVITVEDPVEYRLPGINQVQTNAKAGLTFAAALRSILRSDPDIVLLGEVRDHETAQIAIEAALTGHLVLTTLHTNDAPSAVTRLTEMGIEPFLVGSALDCVLAQRLARRLCPRCKDPYVPSREAMVENRFPWLDGMELPTLYRPVGCSACSKTGYKGRVALHEVMAVSEEIERMAVERESTLAISKVAVEQGMITLREDGLRKVAQGVTSIEEILRVVV